jgi:hypothetical protein
MLFLSIKLRGMSRDKRDELVFFHSPDPRHRERGGLGTLVIEREGV